jgi:DNA gyrase/topoisomerase IV subunit A
MPLSRLVNAERLELQSQKSELETQVAYLTGLMNDSAKMSSHIVEQIQSLKEFADKRRSELVSKSSIGVEKAKTTTKSGRRQVKLPSLKDKIKSEGKKLGMKRTEVAKFFVDNAGNTDLKARWDEFKENWEHNRLLTTRAGRVQRKEALEALKASAIKRGLPKRGQYCWNKFIEGKEKDKIAHIEQVLKTWMANIDAI